MPLNPLYDSLLDAKAQPLLVATLTQVPSEAALQQAALLDDTPSPATLEHTARWIDARRCLTRNGFSPDQTLHVFLRALTGAYGTSRPGPALLAEMFTDTADTGQARALCEYLIQLRHVPSELAWAGVTAMASLATAGQDVRRFDCLMELRDTPVPIIRALLAPLPLARREALVLSQCVPAPHQARQAARTLEKLLAIRDLLDTPRIRAARTSLITAAASDYQIAQLATEEIHGRPCTSDQRRPTAQARQALECWTKQRAEHRRAQRLAPLAEHLWAARSITVRAPELASVSAWMAATRQRRWEIAESVATELGRPFRVAGLTDFGGPMIAVLARGTERFSLIPGGTVTVGLSLEEEAALRDAAESRTGCDHHYEQYGALLEQLDLMRPATTIAVGPLIAAQGPGITVGHASAADELERSRLRLPSEAEWEYLARGGLDGEVTYRGADVPDTTEWLRQTTGLGLRGTNPFGLWGFGLQPETCADLYHRDHQGLPVDGSPRRGSGPRIVKGGAAQLYPWQGCGEWHLLLSAMRTPQTAWEFTLALRYTIGIDLEGPKHAARALTGL
ncbi:formylglycine-generating enzyme family protein [Streptomyces sp. NPDC085614]|uniref:formylglycine-generating enzyme family protein n=1 Tax=Streptomyces sp. NPDC085614 TaxID=3365733 RepID=UPI0037D826AD